MSHSSASAEAAPAFRERPFMLGLALVTGASLALEMLQTRLLSVITWYSLAFLVIAMGLFGLTAGALHVYFQPDEFSGARLGRSLARRSLHFALAIPVSLFVVLCLPLTTAPVATTLVLFLGFGLSLALPFYPAGMVVAAALTRTSLPVGRVYAVDLMGAALGAPLMPLLLEFLDGETAVLAIACIAALGACAFAVSVNDRVSLRSSLIILALALAVVGLNASTRYGLQPLWVKGRLDVQKYDLELWNSHSRIRAWPKVKDVAPLWGGGSRCGSPVIDFRVLEIDAGAGTAMYDAPPDMAGLEFLSCDVTDLANQLRPGGPAAIIGVGGTRDLQAALVAKHKPVYGVELNARMLEIIRGPMGRATSVPMNPNVRLIRDEGRSYFSRSRDSFRVIQASLIDTWAATGAGAHALGENGLYTVEAWRTFMNRLEPNGVLTVSRWTQETLRVASLSVASLLEFGVRKPRGQLILVNTPMVITTVLARDPFTAADLKHLQDVAAEKGFNILVAPTMPVGDPALRRIVDAESRSELDRATLSNIADNRPPTDDRPYFFNVLPIEAAWRDIEPVINMGSIAGNQLATRTLALSFLSSVLLVLGAIVVPLLIRARPKGRTHRGIYAGIAYFGLIGAGFMLAEVALLQKLSMMLGDPNLSLIVVLSSLVASTGLGALVSDRISMTSAPTCYIYPLVIALGIAAAAWSWPTINAMAISGSTPVRIAAAVSITSVLGCLFGLAFPAGMRFAKVHQADEMPWFWGMNGVGSVLASSTAVIISQRWGLTVTLFVAAALYVALLVPIAIWKKA